MTNRLSIIAAVGEKRVIGKDTTLLWHLPGDLKRFKTLTSGHPVIMGRKTWESLPSSVRPLPGRTNIVVSREAAYAAPGAEVTPSFEAALKVAKEAPGAEEIFVIGGGMLYALALPYADCLYLTLVDDAAEGDTFFPPYEDLFTKKLSEEPHEENGIRYRWITLEKEA